MPRFASKGPFIFIAVATVAVLVIGFVVGHPWALLIAWAVLVVLLAVGAGIGPSPTQRDVGKRDPFEPRH